MLRLHSVDQFKHTIYEFLALAIAQTAQGHTATQMSVVVCITSWTLQGTLTGNFDRERGSFSFEDFAPRMNHFGSFHEKFLCQLGLSGQRQSVERGETPGRTAAEFKAACLLMIGKMACARLAVPEERDLPPVQ